MISPVSAQVFATLVSLLFQVENLDFSKPIDHFECFSGDMSVTKGEWADPRQNISMADTLTGYLMIITTVWLRSYAMTITFRNLFYYNSINQSGLRKAEMHVPLMCGLILKGWTWHQLKVLPTHCTPWQT